MNGYYGSADFLAIRRTIEDLEYVKEHLVKDNPNCVKALDCVINELKKKVR